jgi:hypothetical protein
MKTSANSFNPMASFFCLALALTANAQKPWIQPAESPEVRSDRTVTFNFKAPNAKKVELSAQFIKGNQPLKAGTNGLWSMTLGPIEPNLYPHNFIVDGVSVADPNNLNIFLNERVFNDELIGGIFPYVEAHYRVIPDREKRAIGGFSRGGGQSLFAGFVAETLQLYFK